MLNVEPERQESQSYVQATSIFLSGPVINPVKVYIQNHLLFLFHDFLGIKSAYHITYPIDLFDNT